MQRWPQESAAARVVVRADGVLAMMQVIVLEKGGFTPAAELALTEQEGFSTMYEMGGLLTTQDAGARPCLHALCPGLPVLRSRLGCSISGPETTNAELRSQKSGACCLSMSSSSLTPF